MARRRRAPTAPSPSGGAQPAHPLPERAQGAPPGPGRSARAERWLLGSAALLCRAAAAAAADAPEEEEGATLPTLTKLAIAGGVIGFLTALGLCYCCYRHRQHAAEEERTLAEFEATFRGESDGGSERGTDAGCGGYHAIPAVRGDGGDRGGGSDRGGGGDRRDRGDRDRDRDGRESVEAESEHAGPGRSGGRTSTLRSVNTNTRASGDSADWRRPPPRPDGLARSVDNPLDRRSSGSDVLLRTPKAQRPSHRPVMIPLSVCSDRSDMQLASTQNAILTVGPLRSDAESSPGGTVRSDTMVVPRSSFRRNTHSGSSCGDQVAAPETPRRHRVTFLENDRSQVSLGPGGAPSAADRPPLVHRPPAAQERERRARSFSRIGGSGSTVVSSCADL
eukprot:TRINITY_DN9795_c0_g1_i2.p1 TRINITY_DN9795_c0_g1~~TRINITY_DN9795_c0_g1_i2.p1  ORF type:complete len:392 (+),score=63.35 TRINITY_DN9795_c0_g1_i2:71-1246(+)